ncbi:hypothetical protein Tco_0330027, partial [Tanacetum coccineum]
LWTAIKARFGGNDASKKMQKNLLKQQFSIRKVSEHSYCYNDSGVTWLGWIGVSNSNSQNIAFLSTEVKCSTLKQSTVEPAHIPKGYTQAASSTVQNAPNCASHSDEIICSFFAQQASMPT